MQSRENRSVRLSEGYMGQRTIPARPLQDCGPPCSAGKERGICSFYDVMGKMRQ